MYRYYTMTVCAEDFSSTCHIVGERAGAMRAAINQGLQPGTSRVQLVDGLTGEILIEMENNVVVWVDGIGDPFEYLK